MNNTKTVAIAMSGGVDSSVAAKLLLEQGYKVIGITLKLWGAKTDESGVSTAEQDAKKVADILGIQHYIIDAQKYFYDTVIDNFFEEYKKARTPNPCVFCNKIIKFGLLFEEAQKLGADYLATGHYVQKHINPENGMHYLQTALDIGKDQTYVLYNISQERLQKCLFPLGIYNKPQVRSMAQAWQLPVFNKADSQEICFIPDDDYRTFLREHGNISSQGGKFVNTKGEVLGEHLGLTNYTIGQRKGFNIGFGKKMYVLALCPEKNQVVLGDDSEVFQPTLTAQQIVFVDERSTQAEYRCQVKIRYNAKPASALVKVNGTQAEVIFDNPQRAITPGQSVVFYENNILIGGGIIQ